MKRNKTLVKKYLWVNMCVIAISFIILGIMTLSFVINYWKDARSEVYFRDANYIANIVSNNSSVEDGNLVLINSDSVKLFMDTLSLDINVDILVTDKVGNIILYSTNQSNKERIHFEGKSIVNDTINQVDYTKDLKLDDLGGIYESPRYLIRAPVYILVGGTKTIIGSVFIIMDPKPFDNFKNDLFKIFLIVFVISMFVLFWTIRKISYDVIRPLRQMSEAEKCIANGDFSKRISVKSEDEIGKLALAFNDMAESLEVSEDVRKSFIANISHEFKTPMTTISGFINAILDGIISKETEEKYLKIILSEMKRLSGLVKMMLDLSRIDSENIKINYSRFLIKDIIINILISFEEIIQKKNIEIKGLDKDNDIYIYADRDMMYQAIYNLIENAIKFTNYSGYINISFNEDNGFNVIIIENSGKGVSNSEIKFIFDRFYKTDKSRSQDKSGFGLGLYIVKRIISIHNGRIKASSKLNEFTTFEIKIPNVQNNIRKGD